MPHNTPGEDCNANQSKNPENAPPDQPSEITREKSVYDHDHPPVPAKRASLGRSMSFNTTQKLDSQKISASNNRDDLYNNPSYAAHSILHNIFKTFKKPLSKNVGKKVQLFESIIKQKSEGVATKKENLHSQIAELNYIAGETHQSKSPESSNGSILPTDLLQSIDEFDNICHQFDSASKPDVMGASS